MHHHYMSWVNDTCLAKIESWLIVTSRQVIWVFFCFSFFFFKCSCVSCFLLWWLLSCLVFDPISCPVSPHVTMCPALVCFTRFHLSQYLNSPHLWSVCLFLLPDPESLSPTCLFSFCFPALLSLFFVTFLLFSSVSSSLLVSAYLIKACFLFHSFFCAGVMLLWSLLESPNT